MEASQIPFEPDARRFRVSGRRVTGLRLWEQRDEGDPLDAVVATPFAEGSRRRLNVVAALCLLTVAAPAMLLIALLIRLSSRGPVLFVQERVGLNRRNGRRPAGECRRTKDLGGKPFRIYKFRTMRWDPENGDREVWASPDDPRVTALGRVLRKYRLDELPQLLNILRGDMNLVGPRPEQPQIFERMRQQLRGYERRQQVRPGITGLAQVSQHYDRSIEDVKRKLELDLEYIDRQSIREDLTIMLRTVPVVAFRQGAW